MQKLEPKIRLLESRDISQIAKEYEQLGWNKPRSQYESYLMEQDTGTRNVYVAFLNGKFAGYLTICWKSNYTPFQKEGIPEIVDFNVMPEYRRQGIGTQLMEFAENEISNVSSIAGIGVGLDADYGAAQRLYVLRGYIPDGRGLHYKNRFPKYGEQVTVDDTLALHLTKQLK